MSKRILIVDDEPDVEVMMKQHFRKIVKAGELQLDFACDGLDALAKIDAASEGYDVMLSDINMPRMDGLALLRALNDREHAPVAVMVSAYGDMKNLREAMNEGAFDFVTKPVDFEDLDRTLTKSLSHIERWNKIESEREQARKIEGKLSQYFSPPVLEKIVSEGDESFLEAKRRTATFMFTDLKGFSTLMEKTPTDQIIDFLNDYLDGLMRIVFEHGGTILQVLGDGVHAVFGAPRDDQDHATAAVKCALSIDAFMTDFWEGQKAKGFDACLTRIGVHSGEALIGDFGGTHFFDYAAYGTAVNIAARLEQANKTLGTTICISQATKDLTDTSEFQWRSVGDLQLKGLAASLSSFEPMANTADLQWLSAYEEAYALLAAEDDGARAQFARLLGQNPDDPLANFHLSRILSGQLGTTFKV